MEGRGVSCTCDENPGGGREYYVLRAFWFARKGMGYNVCIPVTVPELIWSGL